MKKIYRCPRCTGLLNPSTKIIVRAEVGTKRGLVLFSPQPGNYNAIVSNDLTLRSGDLVKFVCPLCDADLTSESDPRIAELSFVFATSGVAGTVAFAREYGTHATFFITGETVKSYGEHAPLLNHWGAGRDET